MYDVLMYSCGICMPFVCIPNYYVMVRCNDIHLAKVFQYAALSLVGPSSSSQIGCILGVTGPQEAHGYNSPCVAMIILALLPKIGYCGH